MSFLVTVLGYWTTGGVALSRITFACNHSSGGLRVDSAGHVHATDIRVLNFASFGVWGSKLLSGTGHDLVVEGSLFTECTQPMSLCADIRKKVGTGILLEFPDSHVRNSIFTCSLAGVVNRGSANTFTDLHIWTSCTGLAPYSVNTTVGFREEGGTSRISNCHLDNSRFVVSQLRGTTITGSLFQGNGRLELLGSAPASAPKVNESSPSCEYWRGALCGLQVVSNRFICTAPSVCATIDTAALASLPSARWVQVRGNAFEDDETAVCTAKSRCAGIEDCASLFAMGTPCDM